MSSASRLELLSLDHARALERFERANRAFFAARVGDRGDDYFEHFDDLLAARVSENEEGTSLYFVIVEGDDVVGRINLGDVDRSDLTELGFRVAEHAQGRGLATAGVLEALEIAAARGVTTVQARASAANGASRQVLTRCGFAETGPAEAPSDRGQPFVGYVRHLERG